MAMTPQLWSISGLSVELGMDRRTVASRLKDLEPADTRGKTKLYKMSEVVRAVFAPSGSGGDDLDLQQESARLKKAQADKTELEVEVLRGSLIPGEVVERTWTDQIAASRAKLISLPGTVAPRVVGLEMRDIEHELREIVHQALDEMRAYDPSDYTGGGRQQADEAGGRRMGSSAGADSKRVGRRKAGAVKRGKRRTGAVAD